MDREGSKTPLSSVYGPGSCLGKGRGAQAGITTASGEHNSFPVCLRPKAQGRAMPRGLALPCCRRCPLFGFGVVFPTILPSLFAR